MLTNTKKAIAAIVATDQTITPNQIKAALAVLDGGTVDTLPREPLDRLLSRGEVAGLLGMSVKAVDHYCRKGVLTRRRLGDSKRASGILESSVREVLDDGKEPRIS